MKIKIIFVALSLFSFACFFSAPLGAFEKGGESVLISDLITNPFKYHEKEIVFKGYLTLGFENTSIYASKDDMRNPRLMEDNTGSTYIQNAVGILPDDFLEDIRLSLNEEELKSYILSLNESYVLIKGKFNANRHGHLGLNIGVIEKVSYIIKIPSSPDSP